MSRIRRARGVVRLCRGRSDIWGSPGCVPGLFRVLSGLEWADAVAEFVGEVWFGVACEEFLVFDDFAELGEPVA